LFFLSLLGSGWKICRTLGEKVERAKIDDVCAVVDLYNGVEVSPPTSEHGTWPSSREATAGTPVA
jgi:hypothetical protein